MTTVVPVVHHNFDGPQDKRHSALAVIYRAIFETSDNSGWDRQSSMDSQLYIFIPFVARTLSF